VEEKSKELNSELKKLYRNIAKTTHPDKVSNNRLNDLYNEATIAYDEFDIITLYKVSSELNIEFEFDDDFIDSVKSKIDNIKNSANMLENTYTFKWINSNDEERNKIIFEFIKSKIK
jgi:enoyl reductase-like protein